MKRLLIIAFVGMFTCKASAQTKQEVEALLGHKIMNQDEPGLSTKEARKLIGSEVYVSDTVYSYKENRKAEIVLCLGSIKPKEALAILIKATNVISMPANWINHVMNVSGNVILYKGKPAILVTNTNQLNTRIQL